MTPTPRPPRSDTGAVMEDSLTRRSYGFVALWVLGLTLLYVIGGCCGVRALRRYKAETERRREFLIQTETLGLGAKAPGVTGPSRADDVKVGIFLNRLGEFDVHDGAWSADFDIWFRWGNPRLRPGETFELLNGEMTLREKVEAHAEPGEQYERYRVRAKLANFFDPSRYPFGDVALTIQVEDGGHGADELRYVADEQASGVSPLGTPPSLAIEKTLAMVKYHEYGSSLGHSRASPGEPEVRSRFVFAILCALPSLPLHLKNFQALFASVAIALIVFFIRPIHVDPRFGLGVGAAFAAITNNILVASSVPAVDRFTLTAMINAVGLGTIFLTLVESALSLYLLDSLGRERLYRLLDRCSFVVFLIGYLVLNVALPIAALS